MQFSGKMHTWHPAWNSKGKLGMTPNPRTLQSSQGKHGVHAKGDSWPNVRAWMKPYQWCEGQPWKVFDKEGYHNEAQKTKNFWWWNKKQSWLCKDTNVAGIVRPWFPSVTGSQLIMLMKIIHDSFSASSLHYLLSDKLWWEADLHLRKIIFQKMRIWLSTIHEVIYLQEIESADMHDVSICQKRCKIPTQMLRKILGFGETVQSIKLLLYDQFPHKEAGHVALFAIPAALSKISVTHWLDSIAYLASTIPVRDAVSKDIMVKISLEATCNFDFCPPSTHSRMCTRAHAHTHMHTHAHTQTHTHTMHVCTWTLR